MSGNSKFLSRFRPFDRLAPGELERVAAAAEERHVAAGVPVLVEGGTPGDRLYMVRAGSFELLRGERVVDVVTEGEVFGHPTLLTGKAPSFTIRSREASELYVIPRDVAVEVLSSEAGVAFVAETLGERLTRALAPPRASREPRAVHVESLLRRPPVFVEPDTTIRDAAKVMSAERIRSLLVLTAAGLGIVTEGDLRDRVVASGLSPEAPVSTIMTMPVRSMRADRLAPEAAVEMLNAGINHMPVVDGRGKVLGVLSSGSLMRLDALSPFGLASSISKATTMEEVVALAQRLPELFLSLLDASVEAPDISRLLTVQNDTLVTRLLQLAMERHGPPPVPFAWLALGGVARSETTLASDQDNALAFADTDDPAVDRYFETVAADVNDTLDSCGCGFDASDVLARNKVWRKPMSEWTAVFADCLAHPGDSNLVRAVIAFDFRQVTGDLDAVRPLLEVLRDAPEHPNFVARLARTVTVLRSPLGFRQRLIGPVDVKKSAALPIENLARFYAMLHRVTVSGTMDRLAAVKELGVLNDETVTSLQEAFAIIWRFRLQHHGQSVAEGRKPDNIVDSDRLQPLARLDLQAALRAVAAAQKPLSIYIRQGM